MLVLLTSQTATYGADGDVKPGEADARTAASTTWAEIVIKGSYPEGASMPGIFGAAVENLAKVISRLDRVAADEEIAGLVLASGRTARRLSPYSPTRILRATCWQVPATASPFRNRGP